MVPVAVAEIVTRALLPSQERDGFGGLAVARGRGRGRGDWSVGAPGGVQEITYTVPADKCGLVIGKGKEEAPGSPTADGSRTVPPERTGGSVCRTRPNVPGLGHPLPSAGTRPGRVFSRTRAELVVGSRVWTDGGEDPPAAEQAPVVGEAPRTRGAARRLPIAIRFPPRNLEERLRSLLK